LAGPPLAGMPNTRNTSSARETSGGQMRPSAAIGAATASENSATMAAIAA
jgi:hypothetical protein